MVSGSLCGTTSGSQRRTHRPRCSLTDFARLQDLHSMSCIPVSLAYSTSLSHSTASCWRFLFDTCQSHMHSCMYCQQTTRILTASTSRRRSGADRCSAGPRGKTSQCGVRSTHRKSTINPVSQILPFYLCLSNEFVEMSYHQIQMV